MKIEKNIHAYYFILYPRSVFKKRLGGNRVIAPTQQQISGSRSIFFFFA